MRLLVTEEKAGSRTVSFALTSTRWIPNISQADLGQHGGDPAHQATLVCDGRCPDIIDWRDAAHDGYEHL